MSAQITKWAMSIMVVTAAGMAPAQDHSAHHPAPAKLDAKPQSNGAVAAKPEMVDAEVRKLDVDAKKITLKHAPIKSLDMPAMTMVFQLKDPALLANVKVGDKVKFSVEQTKSGYLVTGIEVTK